MISTLTGSGNLKIRNIQISNETSPYVIGIDIFCTDVFNITYGQVVYVGQDESGYTVNVKCNNNEILRYSNLKYVSVNTASYVNQNQKIGIANEYVHFEYATSWRPSSGLLFPVRINDFTYYKQDPTEIIDGKYVVEPIVTLDYAAKQKLNGVDYTEEQKAEFSGGKW